MKRRQPRLCSGWRQCISTFKEFAVNPEPIIITQNGDAKMVVMDIKEYESQQETRALLKLLALGDKEIKEGKFSAAHAFLDVMGD